MLVTILLDYLNLKWCSGYLTTWEEVKWLVGGYSKQSLGSIPLPI